MGFRCSAASAPSCGLVPLLFLFLFLRAALRGLCLLSGRAFLFSGPSCLLSLTSSATGSLVVSLFLMLGFFSCSDTLVSLPLTPSFSFVLLRSAVLPRLSFLSRVVPPEILLATWFDSEVRSIFSEDRLLSSLPPS